MLIQGLIQWLMLFIEPQKY